MKKILNNLAAVGIAAALISPPLCGSEVSGHIRVVGPGGPAAATTVVYAESLDGPTPARPGHYRLAQKNKSFVPHILAIPAGSTVDFPNLDPIFHNVFSLSRPGPFDLGLYRAGDSKSHVFPQPATYNVFCNIHPQMSAVILVLPTSFITETDNTGNYRLNLPPGHYRVTAWSEGSKPVAVPVTVSALPVTVSELTLDVQSFQIPPHKNKYGQDYSTTVYDPMKSN